MAKVLVSQKFLQLKKPAKHKLAFLEVLSNLDEKYSINAKEYRTILRKYDIPLTLNFVGINATDEKVKFDVIAIKKSYDINISRHTRKVQELTDSAKTLAILTQYNKVLTEYHKRNKMFNASLKTYKPTDNKYYNKMCEYFEANRITDYYHYFYTLFYVKEWNQIWPFPRCLTNEALSLYQKHGMRLKEQLITNVPEMPKSQWIDLFDHLEAKKRFYARRDKAQICMNNMHSVLGYHPKSEICQECPVAVACSKRTDELFIGLCNVSGVSLSRLRLGTAEEAQKALPTFDLFS